MKRVVKYLSFCFICLAGFDAQALLTIYGERYAPTETFTEDILVTDGARVEIDKMYMNKTITLENHGYIQGDVIVNPVCDLYVENYGVHSGKIFIESGTSLLQRVKGADSLTGLDVVGDYQVEIHSPEVLSLSDVIANTGGAAIVTIKDTDILITDGVVANSGKIYLDGDIKFYINGFAEDSKQVVMKNVSGDFSSSFIDLGNDVLYAGTGYLEDGILYVQRVRETDYVKIFGNEFGRYFFFL